MKKKHIIFFFLCAAIFASGVLGCIGVLNRPHGTMVEIVRDNEVLYQFDLVQAEDQIIEFEYEGRSNTIEIRDHQIHMLKADCQDKTCVHMGWLDSAAPIVCLPNHLVIQFSDGSEDLDGAAG